MMNQLYCYCWNCSLWRVLWHDLPNIKEYPSKDMRCSRICFFWLEKVREYLYVSFLQSVSNANTASGTAHQQ